MDALIPESPEETVVKIYQKGLWLGLGLLVFGAFFKAFLPKTQLAESISLGGGVVLVCLPLIKSAMLARYFFGNGEKVFGIVSLFTIVVIVATVLINLR